MKKNLKIAVEFDEFELSSKEEIIFAYDPLYEEVRNIVSDLYILGSICEKFESLGLIAIDKKEKAYFDLFKEYNNKEKIEESKDDFVSSSIYFEELYEKILSNDNFHIEIKNKKEIKNPYIKNTLKKWNLEN